MMTRTRVYLHIGMPKTGTTSIQAALNSAKGDFIYPKVGRHDEIGPEAHHMLAGATIRGMPTTVVLYLRNHWDFAVSWYKQMIKHGYDEASSFRKAAERLMPRLDYDLFIQRWSDHFDVRIRLFDKSKNDLLSDFSSVTGIDSLELAESRNVSFGEEVLCSLRLLHGVVPSSRGEFPGRFPPLMQRVRQNIISGRSPGRYITLAMDAIPWIRLMRPNDREWFTARTEGMRQRFLETHVDSEDWHYFDF